MKKSRKKLWITLTAVVASIAVVCLVFGLLFRLKTVSVEFRSRQDTLAFSQLETGILEKVKKDGEFETGKNLLFLNFDENIAKIEKANPFVKVEQIIRRFPNEVGVYISERIPMFRVKDKNSPDWFILDSEFKVLKKITEAQVSQAGLYGSLSFEDKTVEINPDSLKIETYIGEFVTAKNDVHFKEIASGIMAAYDNKDVSRAKSITISEGSKFEVEIVMKTLSTDSGDGCKIVIEGSHDLRTKVYSAVALFSETLQADSSQDLSNSTITVSEGANGKYQATFKTNP